MQSTTSPEAATPESETVVISDDAQPPSTLGPEEPLPARIGRYTVIDRIGRGGMGSVYRAYDSKLRREVALKQVRADRLGPETEARLVQEAQAMARLSHANVVAIYDVEIGEPLTMAMEYVPGQSVAEWLEQAHPWQELLDVFVHAGRGLAAAHAVGLVHRDFKPANVLLGDDGTTKVTDFGLAKAEEAFSTMTGAEPPSVEHEGDSSIPMTRADTVMGTPKYMAPEQHTGGRADARSDQFAFCVSLWEALLGTPPFPSTSYDVLVKAKLEGPPVWPKTSPVPGRIARAIVQGLLPAPEDRHPSMTALLDALESTVGRRHHWWTAGVATVAIPTWRTRG